MHPLMEEFEKSVSRMCERLAAENYEKTVVIECIASGRPISGDMVLTFSIRTSGAYPDDRVQGVNPSEVVNEFLRRRGYNEEQERKRITARKHGVIG